METADQTALAQAQPSQSSQPGANLAASPHDEHRHHLQDLHLRTTNSVDPSLSAIAAFNETYDNSATNQWGKRPAEQDDDEAAGSNGDASKRQHLEDSIHEQTEVPGVHTNSELDIAAAHVQAHLHQQQLQQELQRQQNEQQQVADAISHGDDDDPDYEPDEDDLEQEQAPIGHWGNVNLMDPNSFLLWDANQALRIQSLPILDNLSTQILTTLGKGPYNDTLNIVTQPDSDQGQAYTHMKSLFDQTKKLYTHEPFLSADDLKLNDPTQRTTIRKVNLATFVSSVFGSQEVGFFHLNEHFLDTFVPDGGRLLKSQGGLYLDLKTQAYISAMSTNERGKEEILEDLFPSDIADMLLQRRPGAKQLTPSELDFVHRMAQRRNHLKQIPDDVNLGEKYAWQDFLRDVSYYVSKNHDTIAEQPLKRGAKKQRTSSGSQARLMNVPQQHAMTSAAAMAVMGGHPVTPQHHDVDAQTAAALQAHNNLQVTPTPQPEHGQQSDEAAAAAQIALEQADTFGLDPSYMGAPPAQAPIPQQSAPTSVLYERARQAATAKSSPNARRAGLPSQRRPWTTEEENALMAGLDRVKGPHWSQILAMFGAGGTVSEALKDRNQVQLKDKARNLKLFFLKSGIEVPYYLQFVTGELKTRAPGQAAKNAQKKMVEENAAEDAAHVAAVTALGNVHRAGSQGMDLLNSSAVSDMDMGQQSSPSMEPEGQVNQQSHMDIEHQHQPAPTQENEAAPTADMGMGVPGPSNAVSLEQASQASMAPQALMATMSQQTEAPKEPTSADNGFTVDPALRSGMVGHEVSAERGT